MLFGYDNSYLSVTTSMNEWGYMKLQKVLFCTLLPLFLTGCGTQPIPTTEPVTVITTTSTTAATTTIPADTTAPELTFVGKSDYLEGDPIDLLKDITFVDDIDGDVTKQVETQILEGDLQTAGIHKVRYIAKDKADNEFTYERNITIHHIFRIGETMTLNNLDVSIQSFATAPIDSEPKKGQYQYIEAGAGMEYIIASIQIVNNGATAIKPFDFIEEKALFFELVIGEEATVSPEMNTLNNNWYGPDVVLEPKESRELNLTFEVSDKSAVKGNDVKLTIQSDGASNATFIGNLP